MLTEARQAQILRAQSAVAKKVFAAVPISEPWTSNQIASELMRQRISVDFPIAVGCLNTLIRAGLVVESSPREFIRAPIRPTPQPPSIEVSNNPKTTDMAATEATIKPQPSAKPEAKHSALDRMAKLAARATQLSADVKRLAADIENTALEIAEDYAETESKAEKLQQLQALLKGIE